ncbi:LLM class flavin-dependent oxidoreductase [Amycolatopsis sp. FDAARGOS 1241]|uniref:LLM class flavin-dependent oxidoreductase n=1 Tax=Amycolatopsis sp. FDAARGOS 1241 TaxID=2778070 RepID=UPI001950EB56|nr:LLM class flavin-dependent oxidoreductase [Amycolatopsis sp. FDAARGOS 1241]QRP42704.1 LLM class flavin-dependent oxidoreductase [Amycolatopsis sp. FDAARGOS 1241]
MKIGIGLPNQVRNVNPAVIPAWAARAEQAGFSTLGTFGRIAYPGVMDTVALATAAGATRTVGLLSAVLLGPVWPATLLAKEIASIDGVSGGRLTVGVGVGLREDDFVADGFGARGRGRRFDRDLEIYRDVWRGANVGGDLNPAVPQGTREVPLMFGAASPVALERMARWGEGYIGPAVPASMVAQPFEAARAAWRDAGREGSPRLVGLAYFTLGDTELGRANIDDYYSVTPEYAGLVVSGTATTADTVREAAKQYDELGADEVIFIPGTDELAELARLADIVF